MFVRYTLGDRRRATMSINRNDGSFVGLSEIIATPVFYNDRVYVAIGRDPEHGRGRGAHRTCLDAGQAGDSTKIGKIWTYQGLDRALSTVSIADGLLYIPDVAGRLHCLDAQTGRGSVGLRTRAAGPLPRPWWRTGRSICLHREKA